jgi:hypothetical protein
MKLNFRLGTTSNANLDAGRDYFNSLFAAAQQALASERVTFAQAFAACEYLDIVDGGSLEMNKSVYRQCVAMVGEYLCSVSAREARKLADKSWAANTLVEVMAPVWANGSVREELASRRAA